jgi:nucleotide-binding universal stress UspA family protein
MKILVATDGSEFSRAAIEKCCQMLSLENASIKIISVAETVAPLATEPFAISAEYIQEMRTAVVEQSEDFVADARKVIEERTGGANVELTTGVLSGNPARAVVEEAQNWGADLIVVGSHGYGFWGRIVIGSVSHAVINHAPCSVLIVRKPGQDK